MNGLLELIRRLRTETPRPDVASKTARWFGIICLGVVAWNLFILFTDVLGDFPFKFDTLEISAALVLIALSGIVALLAAKLLKDDPASGARVARLSLWIWLGALVMFYVGFWTSAPVVLDGIFGLVSGLVMVLVFAQFAVPGWFALGYLKRLEGANAEINPLLDPTSREPAPIDGQATSYREGVFPWAAQVTFLVMLLGVMGPVILVEKFLGVERIHYAMIPGFTLLFLGPMAWNELASSFQRSRQILSSSHTGISLLFFNATWPFCKVLVYRDGVEIRVEFTRFFLPYDKCLEPPKREGIFSSSLVFRTRLPGVPESIRIHSGKASAILAEIERARAG